MNSSWGIIGIGRLGACQQVLDANRERTR